MIIKFWPRDLKKLNVFDKLNIFLGVKKPRKSNFYIPRFVHNPKNSNGINKEKMDKLTDGICIDCDGLLLEGPCGGMSQNVICENCGSKFNLSPFFVERI